jgi:hemolysin D
MADELAFLPAALSLQDTPVHPAPRRLAWALMLMFVIANLWAYFGQVDIVAVAPGRIIVSDRTKLIQPLEVSVVRRVLVKDGDRVVAGQVLVELDATVATADKASIQEQLTTAASEERRTAALRDALPSGRSPATGAQPAKAMPRTTSQGLDPTRCEPGELALQAQLKSEWQDISAKLSKFDAEANRRRAELATVNQTIAKLEATVPLAQTREGDYKRLVDQGFVSSHATQDKTRDRIELERDLLTQRARLAEAQSALMESEQSKAAYRAETLRLLSDRHAPRVRHQIGRIAEFSDAVRVKSTS